MVFGYLYTANILTVLSTAFGSVTFPTVIWLCMLPPKTAIDLKLYSSLSLSVLATAIDCDKHCQITEGNVTQPMTVIFAVYEGKFLKICKQVFYNANK